MGEGPPVLDDMSDAVDSDILLGFIWYKDELLCEFIEDDAVIFKFSIMTGSSI